MMTINRAAFPLSLVALLALAPLAHAKTVMFSGTFVSEGSVTNGQGSIAGSVDTDTDKVTYKITYSGLTGPVTMAHFHGPATANQSAGVLLPIPGPYSDGMEGTLKANAKTVKDILDDMTYINLHTAKYPGGEIRAQVIVK